MLEKMVAKVGNLDATVLVQAVPYKPRTNKVSRVFLNLLTGWVCIGFCQGENAESQLNCNTICGFGRCNQPKKLKSK